MHNFLWFSQLYVLTNNRLVLPGDQEMHSEEESSLGTVTPSGQYPAPQETGPEKKRTIFIGSQPSMFCRDSFSSERERDPHFFLLSFCVCVATQEVSWKYFPVDKNNPRNQNIFRWTHAWSRDLGQPMPQSSSGITQVKLIGASYEVHSAGAGVTGLSEKYTFGSTGLSGLRGPE